VVQARERAVLLATIVRTMRASGCHEGQGLEALRLIAGASARALRPALLVAEELLGSGQIIQDDASTFGEIGKQWNTWPARPARFERATCGFEVRCSIQLS
jgi:hypothetical protein